MLSTLSTILLTLAIVLISTILYRKKFPRAKCNITKDLTGKVVIITGGNNGIGKETALGLAKMNATVIIASRDPKKSIPVVDELKKKTGNDRIEFIQLDLADLESIKNFAEKFKAKYNRLDTLINNAGLLSNQRSTTKDGFETVFGTNHLGHFYLTTLLLDLIEKSAPSRVINMSSSIHMACNKINWEDVMYEKGYFVSTVYAQSKVANILFTKELQKRVDSKKVKVVSLHPGFVNTDLCSRLANKWYEKIFMGAFAVISEVFAKTPVEGAQTTLYCALEEHDKLKDAMYYADCKVEKENKLVYSEENCKKMWQLSEELIAKALKK